MRDNNVNVQLFRGNVNKDLLVRYVYTYQSPSNPENKYPSIKQTSTGNIAVNHNYGLSISQGFEQSHLFIGTRLWNQFVTLLEKSVRLVSENLMDLFPDMSTDDFEIDSRALERFQTEKACSVAGITIVPTVWVNSTQQCYPAIHISTLRDSCVIPFEDAIPLSAMLSKMDPIIYGFNTLQLMYSIFG
jgi:hypothetical protein